VNVTPPRVVTMGVSMMFCVTMLPLTVLTVSVTNGSSMSVTGPASTYPTMDSGLLMTRFASTNPSVCGV
jgi:hypothetical protein